MEVNASHSRCFFVYFVRFLFFLRHTAAGRTGWKGVKPSTPSVQLHPNNPWWEAGTERKTPLKHTIPHTHTAAAATSGSDSIKTKEWEKVRGGQIRSIVPSSDTQICSLCSHQTYRQWAADVAASTCFLTDFFLQTCFIWRLPADLKEQFTQKWEFGYYLFTRMLMERQNISWLNVKQPQPAWSRLHVQAVNKISSDPFVISRLLQSWITANIWFCHNKLLLVTWQSAHRRVIWLWYETYCRNVKGAVCRKIFTGWFSSA